MMLYKVLVHIDSQLYQFCYRTRTCKICCVRAGNFGTVGPLELH